MRIAVPTANSGTWDMIGVLGSDRASGLDRGGCQPRGDADLKLTEITVGRAYVITRREENEMSGSTISVAETARKQAKLDELNALSLRINDLFGERVKINVWAKNGDKRVYFNLLSGRREYGAVPLAMYAITGGQCHKPATAYGLPERIKADPALKDEFFAIARILGDMPPNTTLACNAVSDEFKRRKAEHDEGTGQVVRTPDGILDSRGQLRARNGGLPGNRL